MNIDHVEDIEGSAGTDTLLLQGVIANANADADTDTDTNTDEKMLIPRNILAKSV
ncbi:MAG: hypothetical protein GY941_26900 [Planctomycetes bacterium]|nr:hypothetical protein [Planctomycetota bacterium]